MSDDLHVVVEFLEKEVNPQSSHSVVFMVMLYFATSILVRTRIMQFWYVPELCNSGTYQNCLIASEARKGRRPFAERHSHAIERDCI